MTHSSLPLAPLETLENANLRWQEGSPEAIDFDDVYFSREDGRRETEHVFIHHNHLDERFAAWNEQRPFVIAETGFGSGLNALCAWETFQQQAPTNARLHFVSVERFPMTAEDLQRALDAWPEYAEVAQQLVAQWPPAVVGVHRLTLNERFTLDLYFGEASERFSQMDGRVDAWFLDGFAPAKNPDMWQGTLFQAMARLSQPQATFATFTAAGIVKRGLKSAGFEVEKVKGYGRKREMLRGYISHPTEDSRRQKTPWFDDTPGPAQCPQNIAIMGAGIAGCSTAHALVQRGHHVTLFDPKGIAHEASGNHQAALYIKLAVKPNLQSRFYLSGLLYVNRLLHRLAPHATWWQACGTLDIATNDQQAERQQRFLRQSLPDAIVMGVSAKEASRIANTDLSHIRQALFYPLGGWLSPRAFCKRLLSAPSPTHDFARQDTISSIEDALSSNDVHLHPNITFQQHAITGLTRGEDEWVLTLDNQQTMRFDQVVVCTAYAATQVEQMNHLPLQPIRGQVTELPLDREKKGNTEKAIEGQTSASLPALKSVICGKGYLPPAYQHRLIFGATFTPNCTDITPCSKDTEYNIQTINQAVPVLCEALDITKRPLTDFDNRVSLRTASPDKSPFAGAAPDKERWEELYAVLAKDATRIPSEKGPRLPGLWINVAHGSRGMVSAPLCGELIASRINGEPSPMELALVDHLDPGRRIIRDIITREQNARNPV
ncbi:tRNA 5-methylaminomethyl-2-thiouridine biosynthesis bifunctional protein MnmC [Halomonadaceae bacterium LMG 33818]|uniref:bifunctional tRNA (5-methylaminomethyl-2-thiouridine)(34)-methyltransferase MnmD/FAD-dependent 5-carboxymethylaminomethyl-2-thiouridine(34) oxidoreductase MnmC n=1 Tax=Cernens ardua TaxID=3402176 RepID=UPI003EDC09E8